MRIVVMGAGALGAYFGARLHVAGQDVALVARGAHLAAIRAEGLRIASPLGDLHLRDIAATDDPASLALADIVMLAVKLWDTEAAAAAIKGLLKPGGAVISFQNGVMKDEVLTRVLGKAQVMGGVGYIAATIAEPGRIVQTGRMARLAFGELDGTMSARGEALRAACEGAGIDVECTPEITRRIWEKFVFLAASAGCTAALRQSLGPIRENPETRAFLHDVMAEIVAVGRARGVALDEGFADKSLANVDRMPPEMTTSMHGDLMRGNRLELPWLNGWVAKLGAELGIATPLNRALSAVLAPYAMGTR